MSDAAATTPDHKALVAESLQSDGWTSRTLVVVVLFFAVYLTPLLGALHVSVIVSPG